MNYLLSAVAIALLGSTAMAQQTTPNADTTVVSEDTAATSQDAAAEESQTAKIFEVIEGNPDAQVEVVEYASYTCPHCATFHEDEYQKLRENYIDTGLIKFTYREVYFDRPSLWASMIARCGGPLRYAGISDRLFSEQDTWMRAEDGPAIVEELRKIGRSAGMNDEQIDTCLFDAEKAKALVAWSEQNTKEHKIRATPSLVINGTTYSNKNYEDLSEIIDEALED